MSKNILEISVSSKEQVEIAEQGGADRLELTIDSEKGGTTPTMECISSLLINTKLPCFVVLRPRVDTYNITEEEFKELLHQIEIIKLTPVVGVSLGFIKDGKVDNERLEQVIKVKGHLQLVFNHAIDSVFDYEMEINKLINNDGVDWIQTTGGSETFIDGYKRILPFLEDIKPKLIVARGINEGNVEKLINNGFDGVIYQCKNSLMEKIDNVSTLSLDKIKQFSKLLRR